MITADKAKSILDRFFLREGCTRWKCTNHLTVTVQERNPNLRRHTGRNWTAFPKLVNSEAQLVDFRGCIATEGVEVVTERFSGVVIVMTHSHVINVNYF